MSSRRKLRTTATKTDAEDLVRVFHAREPQTETVLPFSWPSEWIDAGVGQAEMYSSNKWKKNPSVWEDYKHIAEEPRRTLIVPGAIVDARGNPVTLHGDRVVLEEPMPQHIAVLGELIGVQVRLFEEDEDGSLVLPGGDDGLFQCGDLPHGMLGAAYHPVTEEFFLVVYSERTGPLMLITGSTLRVEPHGITG